MNGPESRDTLESSFKEIFDEVNGVIKSGYITIDGEQVEIELFVEGDYKITSHVNIQSAYLTVLGWQVMAIKLHTF